MCLNSPVRKTPALRLRVRRRNLRAAARILTYPRRHMCNLLWLLAASTVLNHDRT